MKMDSIFKIKQAWNTFAGNHPKFPQFLSAVNRKGIPADTVIGITIEYPDGEKMETNIKVTASDLQLFETLKGLSS